MNQEPPVVTPSAASVPWSGWLGVLAAVIIFIGSQFAAGLALGLYGAARHLSGSQLNDSTVITFLFTLLVAVLVIGAVRLFSRPYQDGARSMGLRRPQWVDSLYGLLSLVPYFVLFALTLSVVRHLAPSIDVNQNQDVGFSNVVGGGALVLTFLSLVVLAPITEEIIFRGLLYSSLKKVLPLAAAVLTTCLLFAAGHLFESASGDGLLYVAGIDTFVLSLVLIYLREKTNRLYAGMTLHALKNAIAFVALFILHAH